MGGAIVGEVGVEQAGCGLMCSWSDHDRIGRVL